ncbi:hypothetical protein DENSPDRAFT_119404 [Dentipellis sp. KUC8613]|nr:hypothetical protein DENSPDRAFT_119404 [Dentipellis sp. KUC8613]
MRHPAAGRDQLLTSDGHDFDWQRPIPKPLAAPPPSTINAPPGLRCAQMEEIQCPSSRTRTYTYTYPSQLSLEPSLRRRRRGRGIEDHACRSMLPFPFPSCCTVASCRVARVSRTPVNLHTSAAPPATVISAGNTKTKTHVRLPWVVASSRGNRADARTLDAVYGTCYSAGVGPAPAPARDTHPCSEYGRAIVLVSESRRACSHTHTHTILGAAQVLVLYTPPAFFCSARLARTTRRGRPARPSLQKDKLKQASTYPPPPFAPTRAAGNCLPSSLRVRTGMLLLLRQFTAR